MHFEVLFDKSGIWFEKNFYLGVGQGASTASSLTIT